MAIDAVEAGLIGAGAAVFGGVVGGLLSGAYQHIRDHLTRPQLILEFNPDADSVEASWSGDQSFDGVVLRASVSNSGQTAATNCRVFLVGLTTLHHSGSTPTAFRDSRQVAWAGWSFEARTVQRGVTFYVDLVRVSKEGPGWQFTFHERMAQDESLRAYRGTYSFRLVAVADNAEPVYLDIPVDYNGDWHNLRAWKPTK